MSTAHFSFDVVEALNLWFSNIRGYYRPSPRDSGYYHEDHDSYFINGADLIEAVLDRLGPYVTRAEVDDDLAYVDVDLHRLLYDYALGTGSRGADYDEQDLQDELAADGILGFLTGIMREMEIRVDPYQYVHEDLDASQDAEDAPIRRHSAVTPDAKASRKDKTMTQRTPQNRTNAAVARAKARTAMKLRMENQRTAAVKQLRRRLAAIRAARTERVATAQHTVGDEISFKTADGDRGIGTIVDMGFDKSGAQMYRVNGRGLQGENSWLYADEIQGDLSVRDAGAKPRVVTAAQPARRPSRILRSAAERPARPDHQVATRSIARDEVRRRIAAIRQRAAQATQESAAETKPTDRFAALRERLAQRRRIAAIRQRIAVAKQAQAQQDAAPAVRRPVRETERDARVAPPIIRVRTRDNRLVRYERID